MICIVEIKTVCASREYFELCHLNGTKLFAEMFDADGRPEMVEVKREMVTGDVFVTDYGEKVCIGMSQQVRDALRIPLKAFENMNRELQRKNKILNRFRTAGFFKRLHYAFKGYLPEESEVNNEM